MEGTFAAGVARVEHLDNVELATAGCPAGAVGRTVLQRAGDLCIEHPDGRHVHVGTRGSIVGHGELEEEDLFATAEAV